MRSASFTRSLSLKFLAVLISTLTLTAIIVYAIYARTQWHFAHRELHEKVTLTAAIHESTIAHPLWNQDEEELGRNLATLARHSEITCVELAVNDRKITYQWPLNCTANEGEPNTVSRLILNPGNQVGRLKLHYTSAGVSDNLKQDLAKRAFFLVLFFSVGALGSWATLQWIVGRPVARLMGSIRKSERENIREPVEWESNDELGSVITAYNRMLKQIDENTQELVTAREQAESAAITKNRFLASMSHELRTPLNAVIGITEMLREDAEDSHEDTEPYERISGSGRHLLQLIDDILDFTKIESGKVELVKQQIVLLELLDDAVATTRSLADEHGNNLSLEFDGDPATLLTDPLRLRQVLINLLSNACKFTENGSVTLSVTLIAPPESAFGTQPRVHFCVTDSGIGISDDRRDNLFKDFSQADSSITRKYGGTGLGLAISQRLCHLLGGEITVNSIVDKGSQFSFDLPV